jgi:ligand-binding SRPBCC domain-containing protein
MARVHILEREQRIEAPIGQAFEVYGDARNLERITPPWLGFGVTTPEPIEMGAGTLIVESVGVASTAISSTPSWRATANRSASKFPPSASWCSARSSR